MDNGNNPHSDWLSSSNEIPILPAFIPYRLIALSHSTPSTKFNDPLPTRRFPTKVV